MGRVYGFERLRECSGALQKPESGRRFFDRWRLVTKRFEHTCNPVAAFCAPEKHIDQQVVFQISSKARFIKPGRTSYLEVNGTYAKEQHVFTYRINSPT